MIWAKSEIVLRVMLSKFRENRDGLEVFSPVVELERQRSLANLAGHVTVFVPVTLPQVGLGLRLGIIFSLGRHGTNAKLRFPVRIIRGLLPGVVGPALGIGRLSVGDCRVVAVLELREKFLHC